MYRSSLGALLFALALCSTVFGQSATPQFAVVDLGPITIAGSGLAWQVVQPTPTPSYWPSTGGSACYGVSTNHVYTEFGSEAVGSTCTTAPNLHAAKWTWDASGYTLTDLGVLPNALGGPNTGGPSSEAYAFNNVGDIVGGSDSPYLAYTGNFQVAHHAFVYTNGVMTDLGAIAGQDYYSEAESVNDSHEIVGNTQTVLSASGAVLQRAFLYTNGTMYNLTFYLVGGPTVLLSDAKWIDCQGNIAALGTPAAGGNTHSYLLVRQGTARDCPD